VAAILNDLDIRASDLLQSNGIVWVEGPSDRVYLVDWISKWSGRELREGVHYQCVFYGGRLLSRLTAEGGKQSENGPIDILLTNRNLVMVMDSDKNSKHGQINATKRRMRDAVQQAGGYAWVTKGREIENYLPAVAVASYLGVVKAKQSSPFRHFDEYIDAIQAGAGRKYLRDKVRFASSIVELAGDEALARVLDLDERMKAVVGRIRAWNGAT
jgi:putative ATP-dependent endonuclease of OLD family